MESLGQNTSRFQIEHINPPGLNRNPAFTNVVTVSGPSKTIYIGGQDAIDANGQIVGVGDVAKQTEKVLENLQTALAAAGAGIEHVVKWNVYVVAGQSLAAGFEAFKRMWGMRPNPPAITGMYVSALANPAFLVEMDAVAVVPA